MALRRACIGGNKSWTSRWTMSITAMQRSWRIKAGPNPTEGPRHRCVGASMVTASCVVANGVSSMRSWWATSWGQCRPGNVRRLRWLKGEI